MSDVHWHLTRVCVRKRGVVLMQPSAKSLPPSPSARGGVEGRGLV
jgi:hypothetical protein